MRAAAGASLVRSSDRYRPGRRIGEQTTYTVTVTNQGDERSSITNVATHGDHPRPTSPSSPAEGGTISGSQVTYGPIAEIAVGGAVTYTITVTAVN